MRFLSITYRKFGPFDHVTLDVSQGSHGLHLIYGRNEAGKTTALRGLGYFLFGFPHHRCDDYRYNAGDQRIGAKLRDHQGGELEWLRRRGKSNTLRGADDRSAVADDRLRELLAGMSAEQFDMLFGLNHQQLIDGGQEIVAGKGGLGEALFAAGAGLAGLRRIDQQLQGRREDLYKPRGQNQPIAISLRSWHAARDQVRAQTLQIERWTAEEETLRQALARQDELEAERNCNREELRRLEAFRSALPAVGVLAELLTQVANLHESRRLDDKFADEHRRTLTDLHAARTKHDAARKEVARFVEEVTTKTPRAAIVAEEQAIEKMQKALGSCAGAERDRLGLHARMREHQGSARQILQKYFSRNELAEAESLRLNQAAQDRIRALSREHLALKQAVADSGARIEDLLMQIAVTQQALAGAGEAPDVSRLDVLVRSIMQEGPLELNLRAAEIQLTTDRAKAQAVLKRLETCWRGTMDQATELIVPTPELVQLFQAKFEQLAIKTRELEKQRDQNATALRERNRHIERLTLAGQVPTEQDLQNQRRQRDTGLDLVRDEWLGQGAPRKAVAEFIERYAPNKQLLDALQGGIHTCDEMADHMRHEAKRASELSLCQMELRGAEQEQAALWGMIQAVGQERLELEERWQAEWKGSAVEPKSSVEMAGWLQHLAQLREQSSVVRQTQERVSQLKEHIERCRAELRQALAGALHDGDYTLVQLLEMARQRIELAGAHKQTRAQRDDQLRALTSSHQRELVKAEQAEQRLEEWKQQWGAAVQMIGLTSADDPATAQRYLDQLTEMFRELREAGTLELRLKGIDRDREQFFASLNALRTRLDGANQPSVSVESMSADVDALVRQLNDARQLQTQRELLEAELERAQRNFDAAEQTVIDLDARLQTLVETAGVDRVDEIPLAIERSAERRRLEQRIAEEKSRLHQQARGLPLDRFMADAVAARDTLEARLAALLNRVEPLDEEIKQQAVIAAAARKQLEDWRRAGAAAADAQQEMASLAARLGDQLREYAALHLAQQVLKQAIERFRQRRQNSMLSRAEHFFRLLTDGAFGGLEVDEDEDGQTVLLAMRAQPAERVLVAGLSDGTRDQLFLALRLAGIEQHLTNRAPMPLVVDDILVNFDEQRVRATLACLTELSRQTQVLLFTHHAYLMELARRSVPNDVLFCHGLGDGDGAGQLPR